MCQANTEACQSIDIDDLLANPKVEANSGDLSDNDQIKFLSTLEELVFLFYNNGRLIISTTLFRFFQFNKEAKTAFVYHIFFSVLKTLRLLV